MGGELQQQPDGPGAGSVPQAQDARAESGGVAQNIVAGGDVTAPITTQHGPAVESVAQSQGVQAGTGNVQNNYYSGDRRSQPDGPVVVGSVPQAPQAFQPREDLLTQLRAAGSGLSVVRSVTGIRGVGKTQVAAAYARECINAGWRVVAWVNAQDEAEALAGLALVAARLELGQLDTPVAELGQLVRGRLEADGDRCLLVFDNVTDLKPLRDYIPAAGKAQVIVTTTSTAALGRPVPVDVFTEDEALVFLAERTRLADPEGAATLAEELGCLPLALAQAAAVITEQHLTYAVYLDRLRQFPLTDYLISSDDDPYPRGVAEAIVLSAEALAATDQIGLCTRLLDLIALLSPGGVSRDLLHTAGFLGILPGEADSAAIDAALGRLARVSLLTFGQDSTTVTAHRLVTRVTRERRFRDGALPALAAQACKLLYRTLESLSEPWHNRRYAREAVAHIIAMHEHLAYLLRDTDLVTTDLLDLRGWAQWCLLELGDSATLGIEFGMQLLTDREHILGSDHPETLISRSNLAMAYQAAGRFDEAIPLHKRAIGDCARILGPLHSRTLASRNNLADAYRDVGRIYEAIPLYERTLTEGELVLGSAHPRTLVSRNNLAGAYRAIGRLDMAIPLYERVLADCERVLGPTHPYTLVAHSNLALACKAVGQLGDAIPRLEQALAGLERVLGPEHPDTVIVRDNLAHALREAEEASGRDFPAG